MQTTMGRGRTARGWGARCLLLLAAAFAMALLGASHAQAATGLRVTSSPHKATTATLLTWRFEGAGPQASCELTRGASVVSAPADCSSPVSYGIATNVAGQYTLTIDATNSAAANGSATPSITSTVTVAPAAPTITAEPTSAGHHALPVWKFSLPTGSVGTCEVEDAAGHAVQVRSPCSSPFKADLAGAKPGRYSLSLYASAGGVLSPVTRSGPFVLQADAPATPVIDPPASPSRDSSPTFGISDTDPVTLTCLFTDPTGATVFDDVCPADGTFSTVGYPDGTYLLQVTATDAGGDTSVATANWTKDTTPPPAPTVTAPTSPGQSRQPNFTVSDSEDGVSYSCSVSGPAVVSVSNCGDTTVIDLTSAPDGNYTLRVQAVDEAGNISDATSATYTLVTTAPPAPNVIAPPSPGNTRTPAFTLSDDEANVSYDCEAVDSAGNSVTVRRCASTAVLNLAGSPDGAVTLTVNAVDSVGNVSAATVVTWVLDTTPPTAPVVGTPSSPGNTSQPTFTVTDPDGDDSLTCLLISPGGRTVASGSCPSPATFNTNGYADGTYTLTVTATDPAGNPSATTVTWVRDTTPPPAPQVQGPASPSNAKMPVLTVSDADPTVSYLCSADGPSGEILVPTCGASTPLDLRQVPDGTITVTITAVDPAGNVGASTIVTWVLDTGIPQAPEISGPSLGNSRTVAVTLSDGQNGVTYQCSATGPDKVTVTACQPDGSFTIGGGKSPGEGDGVYLVTVAAVDAAGNISATTTFSYVLDTTPPPAPAVSHAPQGLTNSVDPTVSIADAEGDVTLTCVISGEGAPPLSENCPESGVLDTSRFANASSPDGVTITLTVTATDPAGNETISVPVHWILETDPPAAPAVSFVPKPRAQPSNSLEAVFDITPSTPGDQFSCTAVDPVGNPVPVAVSDTTCTIDLTGSTQAQGTYVLRVIETDEAGNTSSVARGTYIFDSIPPAVPQVSRVTLSPGRSRTPLWNIGAGADDASFECRIVEVSPSQALFPWTQCDSGTFQAAALKGTSGVYKVEVYALDSAGNRTSSVDSTYRFDRIKPDAPAVSLQYGSEGHVTLSGLIVISDLDPALSAETTGNVQLTCSLILASAPTGTPGTAVPCGPDLDLSAYDMAGGVATEFRLTVTATDAAGNVKNTVLSFELDTIAPASPILNTPVVTGLRTVSFSWILSSFGDVARCEVVQNGVVVKGPVTCSSGWQARLPHGNYTFIVVAADKAGNVSAPATTNFALNKSALLAPTVTPVNKVGDSTDPRWIISTPSQATHVKCLVTGPGLTPSSGPCPVDGRTPLTGGRDGIYTLSVTAVLPNGSVVSARAAYVLDRIPPGRPTLINAPRRSGEANRVTWGFQLPPGTQGRCSLLDAGRVVAGPTTCNTFATYTVSTRSAGPFTLRVVAVDKAGVQSRPLDVPYELGRGITGGVFAGAPTIIAPTGQGPHPVWRISDRGASRFVCSLTRDGVVVDGERTCGDSYSAYLGDEPSGVYELRVQAVSANGSLSQVSSATYSWNGGPSEPPTGPISPARGGTPPRRKTPPSTTVVEKQLPPQPVHHVKPAAPPPAAVAPGGGTPSATSTHVPYIPTAIVPPSLRHLDESVQAVVSNIGSAGGGAGFPLLLILVVALFLVVQNRIDRRDPKLALAAVGADDMVEFTNPPSLENGR